ncbi:MAG TPA: copper resistance protein CopC [Thermoleophilaceae bacterium]|nr:copper resistance protein CopC [Thermoleophilaceae bacterium]
MKAALVLAVVVAALAAPAGAAAHATVVSTAPEQGAALPREPGRVVFRFSENVETRFGAVRVFDARGRRVDRGATTQPNASSAAVTLRPGLPDGPYTATYRVVSADSHPVRGGFTFTVGRSGGRPAAAVAGLLGNDGAGPVTDTAFSVVKGAAYAATALLAGGALFAWLAWMPPPGPARRRWRGIGVGAGLAGAALAAAGLVLQGAEAGGTSFWSALDPDVLHDVLATGFGRAWAVWMAAFVTLAVVLAPGRRGRAPVAVAAAAVAALVITPAFAGHANATDPRALMLATDALHVAAMSAWVGGVAVLVLVLPLATRQLGTGERTRLLATVVARFSTIALAAVGTLVATGVLQSVVHLQAFGDLVSTGYGRAILIKSALVLLLVAAGTVNHRRTLPRLRERAGAGETPGGPGLALRRVIRGELALMAVAIGVTAALVGYAPPAGSTAGPASRSADLGPARLEMTVAPARVGANDIHLYLLDRRSGAQYDRPKKVDVTARLPAKGIGPLKLEARKTGPGHYTVPSATLAPAGDWRLEVDALVSEFDQYTATVGVSVR